MATKPVPSLATTRSSHPAHRYATVLGPFHTHANYSRERSRSRFGPCLHTDANANIRAKSSREQFASFCELLANESNSRQFSYLLIVAGRK